MIKRKILTPLLIALSLTMNTLSQFAFAGYCNNKIIDVHHHALPDFYVEAVEDSGTADGGVGFPQWNAQKSQQMLRNLNIASAVLSVSAPGTYFGDAAKAVALSRRINENLASVVRFSPKQFGFYATLPTPLVQESINEAIYALDELNADAVILLANSSGVFLGDPQLDPILEVLNERNTTVFIHPNNPADTNLNIDAPIFASEFVIDTTRAVTNMLWNGTFEKFPNIQWILAHGGGTIPYISWRLSLLELQFNEYRKRSPKGTKHYLKQLYYDTALSPSENTLYPLINQFGVDNVVYGSDFPFSPSILAFLQLFQIRISTFELSNFSQSDVSTIHSNGYKLFPRLERLNCN